MKKFKEEYSKFAREKNYDNSEWMNDLKNHFKDWHSDEEFQLLLRDRDTLKQGNDNLFKNHLELVRENDELKSQLKQQALPEIPKCVAEFITKLKKANNNLTFAFSSRVNECPAKYWNEAILWLFTNPEDFAQAWINGYTVTKEKRFYLKHKSVLIFDPDSDDSDVEELYLGAGGNFVPYKHLAKIFTQSQIDSMETGSYEQIEVQE